MENRVLVISDIHGMVNELCQLLSGVHYRPSVDRLYVLGDYIDRGPNSRQVLDLFMKLKERAGDNLVLLKGNHEDMCVKAFRGDTLYGKEAVSLWTGNGGDATIMSFGDCNPWPYIEFMEQLPLYAETDDFIFVHGGVVADRPLSQTDADDLLWNRSARPHMSGKTVVVGHTIHPEVTWHEEAKTLCIDTGACKAVFGRNGRLSLVDLTNNKVHWLETGTGAAVETVTEELDFCITNMLAAR